MLVGSSRRQVLRRRSEFVFLSKNGRRAHINSWLVINFSYESEHEFRFGLTIPKYVGNAVLRNKIKRRMRELVKNYQLHLKCPNVDINFVLKRQEKLFYQNLGYGEFESAFIKVCQVVSKSAGPKKNKETCSKNHVGFR